MKGSLCIAALLAATNAFAQSPLERGKYLVEGILTCGNCHTPRGPGGVLDTARRHAGSPAPQIDTPEWSAHPTNITPDKETGIGSWTDAEIKAVLRTGIRPNGVHVAMIMPTGFYHIMTDRDVDAVVAYLRTIKPVSNKVADPIYKMPQVEHVLPGGEKPFTEAMMSDKVKKGFYLATIAHCMECHTPMEKGVRQWDTRLGAGGFEFPGPWGVSVSRNITSSKTKGIGAWTDEEIKRAITTGVDRQGNKLKPPMGFQYYSTVSADDLDALVAYLRTVPAID
jgi:mono/diheme cytochrome c family protein